MSNLNLLHARVLISNDDGVTSQGLRVLEGIAKKIFKEVWVVAPELEQSGTSHSLTLHRPLRVRRIAPRRYAVDGTPADSILLGVQKVMRTNPPDIVLSGVNPGANLGADITYSGTVAAAMEGTLLGVPSVAFSQYYKNCESVLWSTAEAWIPKVMETLFKIEWPAGVLMNVNLPDVSPDMVSGIEVVRQGRRKIGGGLIERKDPRGNPYYWIGAQRKEDFFCPETDSKVVVDGGIAVTPLSLDLTHHSTLLKMKQSKS